MNDTPDRRRDPRLRQTINQYREMALQAEGEAASCDDPVRREQYLALSKSVTELADGLQGRPSKPSG